jgi:heat shock protein HslJ
MKIFTIIIRLLAALFAIYFATGCSTDTYKYDLDIRNKYWKLIELEGDTVKAAEGQREAHIVFRLNNDNLNGSGGCNNFSGKYEIIDDSVQVGPLAVTKMYCDSVMDQEVRFLNVLEKGGRFTISNENLDLYSGNKIIARFKAIYF